MVVGSSASFTTHHRCARANRATGNEKAVRTSEGQPELSCQGVQALVVFRLRTGR